MKTPELLPPEQCLETSVREDFDELSEVINSHYIEHNSFEQSEIDLINERFRNYAGSLADILYEGEANEYVRKVALKSFFFAYTTSDYILPDCTSLRTPGLEADDTSEIREKIISDVNEFLLLHPQLDKFIDSYLILIDPYNDAPWLARIVAGHTFLHIEDDKRQAYTDAQFDEMTKDLSRPSII